MDVSFNSLLGVLLPVVLVADQTTPRRSCWSYNIQTVACSRTGGYPVPFSARAIEDKSLFISVLKILHTQKKNSGPIGNKVRSSHSFPFISCKTSETNSTMRFDIILYRLTNTLLPQSLADLTWVSVTVVKILTVRMEIY